MRKKQQVWKRGMVILLMILLTAGVLPTTALNSVGETSTNSSAPLEHGSYSTDVVDESEKGTDEKTVTINSVTEVNGKVKVVGTAENLGQRKVEIIVNNDLNMRYVAQNDENGNFVCEFDLLYNGAYTIEASIRDYSDFNAIRQTTPDENYFEMEGACTWGASPVKHTDGLYYIIFSTWDENATFNNWASASEVGYAVSTKIGGPYVYQGRALDAAGSNMTNEKMPDWGDGALKVFHCPTMMYSKKDGKYYLYFISSTGSSAQKIGVAYADSPAGPWTISEEPVITTRPGHIDDAYVTNPTVIEILEENGEYSYYAVYRANGTADNESGYIRASAYATATSPVGPFKQSDELIMVNPNAEYSVEDCYVWRHNGLYYALAKDMSKGGLTGYTDGYSYALYESVDGVEWDLSENALAYPAIVPWASGDTKAAQLERAQLYIEDSIPFMSFNATTVDGSTAYSTDNHTCNVQIPLLGVALASDTYELQITYLNEKTVDKSELTELLELAESAKEKYYTDDAWWSLYTAKRAGNILLKRSDADQADVDFVVAELKKVMSQRIDPLDHSTNIALNKPVVASSVYSNTTVFTFPAELAVDGSDSTRWSAANNTVGTLTFEIDLQGRYYIENFNIKQFTANRITEYTWEYYDGEKWNLCFTGTDAGETVNLTDDFAVKKVAEKLRLNMVKYNTTPTIWEIEVYGEFVSKNISQNKSVTANSVYNSTYSADKAVDGDLSTRWSANWNENGQIITYEIDLAGKYHLESFKIKQFTARLTEYVWEYYDGEKWNVCYNGTDAGTTVNLIGTFSGQERAERLRLSMNQYNNLPTIYEIEVFGTFAYGNIALHKPVVADSVYSNTTVGTFPAELAVDGDNTTRWSAANNTTGTLTFEIDLQGRYYVESFNIKQFSARLTEYVWEYYDGEKWNICYSGTDAGTTVDLADDFSVKAVAEYLRLNMVKYNTTPTIWEIEVYGGVVNNNGVTLDKEELPLHCGETAQLTAIIDPVNATDKRMIWTSSNESVVTVDSKGKVSAVGLGEATVTVTAKNGGFTDSCNVTVSSHSSGNLIVDIAATCTLKGKGHKDCVVCGELAEDNIEIAIDPDAHKWEMEYTVDTEAALMQAGSKSIHCEYCDESDPTTAVEIPAISSDTILSLLSKDPEVLKSEGAYSLLWTMMIDPNVEFDFGAEDIRFTSYGMIYSNSEEKMEEYVALNTHSEQVQEIHNVKRYAYDEAEEGKALTRIYKTYRHEITNVPENKKRFGMAYIRFEYNGETYEVYSPITDGTILLGGMIGGNGSTIEEGDTLDD